MDKYKDLTNEALAALGAEKRTALTALFAAESPTDVQITEAEALAADITEIDGELAERETAATERTAKFDALKAQFTTVEVEDEVEEVEDEVEDEPEAVVEDEPEAVVEPPKAAATKKVVALAKKTARPVVPAKDNLITITAAADSGFPAGSEINMANVGEAAVQRLRGMPEPTGDGLTEDLRMFPIAKVGLDFPEELRITRTTAEPDQVLNHAANESRLDGGSLVASAGWCSPSETLYDLCGGEVVDGMVSLPEVQVTRGGFKHTTGIDFATVYAGVGFLQTETQAIAGTSKTFYEVPCPTFTDERLDAIGLGIKVPILLQSAYPEVVTDIMNKSMIAHQYKVNASVVTRMLALAGAARVYTGIGSVVQDTLNAMDLVLAQTRQKFRIGSTATLEVVLPIWAKAVFRNDLSIRNGRPPEAVSDAEIMAHFSVRGSNVQFIYGWQELATTVGTLTFPATLQFMAYPAGTFVKGVSDVINLSAVYDAASLAVNLYTGLFFEEGLLVAQMCYQAVLGTVTNCAGGRTGVANITC